MEEEVLEEIVLEQQPLSTVICLYAHDARMPLHVKDLTQNGRWDLICRCLVASLMRSCGVRRDVEFKAYLAPMEKVLAVDGRSVWHLRCDERNAGYTVERAMKGETAVEQKCLRGWRVEEGGEKESSSLLLAGAELVLWLCEEGEDPADDVMGFLVPLCRQYRTIHVLVGDKQDISPDEMSRLAASNVRRWSLGKLPLLASQCITIAQYFLDRARQQIVGSQCQ